MLVEVLTEKTFPAMSGFSSAAFGAVLPSGKSWAAAVAARVSNEAWMVLRTRECMNFPQWWLKTIRRHSGVRPNQVCTTAVQLTPIG